MECPVHVHVILTSMSHATKDRKVLTSLYSYCYVADVFCYFCDVNTIDKVNANPQTKQDANVLSVDISSNDVDL